MLTWLIFIFGLLLPVSWAKHWLIPSSLVNGVLVDYLMPDLWFQDILALLILLIFLGKINLKNLIKQISIFHILGLLLIISTFYFSSLSLISVINFGRFLLAFSLSLVLLKKEKLRLRLLLGLAGGVVWSSLLAIGQFIYQGTVFGWKFLGEPIFSLGTGGIKKINFLGTDFLAPMATFPHANVMGVFGLLTFLVFKNKKFKFFSLILALLSFSIPIYLVLFYWLVCEMLGKKNKLITLVIWSGLSIVFLLGFYHLGFIEPSSIYRRWELAKASFFMIKQNPLFGIGWGTFVKSLPNYSKQISFLQPVHNIFLLVLSEIGIVGTSGIVLLLKNYWKKIKSFNNLGLIIAFLFMFDHYFWSVTQGIYLLFLVLSLGENKPVPESNLTQGNTGLF